MFRYTVRPGDTLYKISSFYNVPINAIMAANPEVNPYDLLIGQIIMIPIEQPGFPIENVQPFEMPPIGRFLQPGETPRQS